MEKQVMVSGVDSQTSWSELSGAVRTTGLLATLATLALLSGCSGDCEDDGFGSNAGGDGCPAVGATPVFQEETDSEAGMTGEDSDGIDEPSAGPSATLRYCDDVDGDGFGDPQSCVAIALAEGETPPPGSVLDDTDCDDAEARTHVGAAAAEDPELCTKDVDQDGYADAGPPEGVDPGSDCLDENPAAFPGAAELDDPDACMEDADDDGYGDSLPPPGAVAGTDCADTDVEVPVSEPCTMWCLDADSDQYGDPEACVVANVPPEAHVGNNADCDDSSEHTFPGAAPEDNPEACLKDVDGDDYGDANPGRGVDAGSDCDDLDPQVNDACFACPADSLYCDASGNLAQCNEQGTFGTEVEVCAYGCSDEMSACEPELTVDAGQCINVEPGAAASLSAVAAGGDGTYTYSWTPPESLTVTNAADTEASPSETTMYSVEVEDGLGNVATDAVTVHVTETRDLAEPGCSAHAYQDIFGVPGMNPSSEEFYFDGEVYCNLTTDSLPTIYVCPEVLENVRVDFRMQVLGPNDDDALGFVWGWQDPSHFYLLSWKQTTQSTVWGDWEQGITIKRIDAPSAEDLDGADLAGSFDTVNSTVLATPETFYSEGWVSSNEYAVTLELNGDDTTITIRNYNDGALIAQGTVSDSAYPSGSVGSYEASQQGACNGYWTTSCL